MPQGERAPGIVVVQPIRDWTWAECGGAGDLLKMEDSGPLCLECCDLDHLVFLPSGDAALTRRSTKTSALSAIMVRWSRNRQRYERRGVLVEESALAASEQECKSDEDARMRRRERDRIRRVELDLEFQSRMAEEIRRLFPGCPVERAAEIAERAGERGSDRLAGPLPVGRWTNVPSCWPLSHQCVIGIPGTALC